MYTFRQGSGFIQNDKRILYPHFISSLDTKIVVFFTYFMIISYYYNGYCFVKCISLIWFFFVKNWANRSKNSTPRPIMYTSHPPSSSSTKDWSRLSRGFPILLQPSSDPSSFLTQSPRSVTQTRSYSYQVSLEYSSRIGQGYS